MSALSVPPAGHEAGLPVPWRRMGWVIWRQHRGALTGISVLLGGLALYMWLAGRQLHHTHAAALACYSGGHTLGVPIVCSELTSKFNGMNKVLRDGYVLQAVPALIGASLGAPILARELETGTFRYAWTQGFGRSRWTIAKLVALAIVVAVAAEALSMLLSWYYQPYLATGNTARSLSQSTPFAAGLFDLRGVAFAAWTLTAFAIGAVAGVLIRRVVPAIVATTIVYAGLALATTDLLRRHYRAPVVTSRLIVPGSAWITRQWGTKGGTYAFPGTQPQDVFRLCPPSALGGGKGQPGSLRVAHCLVQHGYTLWTSYQPASRFSSFQWIEAGWLLALSAALITATVLIVRRRAT